jgi:hypothetical protein
MDTRPVVTLMSDYSCGWPLWARGSLDDASAEALGLSEELAHDLLELQDVFDAGFHWERGWQRAGDEERYARLAVDTWYRLKRELHDQDVDVEIDLWPVGDGKLWTWLRRAGVEPP